MTLVFYRLGEKWWKEPFLNILAASAQFSKFTHVELAIGADSTASGAMTNVCRVFNDEAGVVSVAMIQHHCAFLARRQRLTVLVRARVIVCRN